MSEVLRVLSIKAVDLPDLPNPTSRSNRTGLQPGTVRRDDVPTCFLTGYLPNEKGCGRNVMAQELMSRSNVGEPTICHD